MNSEWISVEERLPEKPMEVTVFCFDISSHYAFAAAYVGNGKFIAPEYLITEYEQEGEPMIAEEVCPTHWMPLPEPPKVK